MRRRLMVSVGLLMGCTTAADVMWVHPGYSAELWARDRYECERQAQAPGLVAGVPVGRAGMVVGVPLGTSTDVSVYSRCLEARGWRLVRR